MPDIENPTEDELKATLEKAELPVGADIEARLGKAPATPSADSEEE